MRTISRASYFRPVRDMRLANSVFTPTIEHPEADERLAGLLEGLLSYIDSLLDLPAGWDAYGAPAIQIEHVDLAAWLVSHLMRPDTPTPSIIPTASGGVQIEWHSEGIDFEVETVGPTELSVYFRDSATGLEWERDIDSDWSEITRVLDDMTRRRKAKALARG